MIFLAKTLRGEGRKGYFFGGAVGTHGASAIRIVKSHTENTDLHRNFILTQRAQKCPAWIFSSLISRFSFPPRALLFYLFSQKHFLCVRFYIW